MARQLLPLVLLLGSFALAQGPTANQAAPSENPQQWVEVFTATSPDHSVTAHFLGEQFASNLQIPFGVHKLQFTFAGDPTTYDFTTDGEITFTAWNTKIFSPSGDWVVLLKGQHGPFVVVSTKRLKDYLRGAVKPDRVIAADELPKMPKNIGPPDYQFVQWTTYDGFMFSASTSGKEMEFDYQIPQKALTVATQ